MNARSISIVFLITGLAGSTHGLRAAEAPARAKVELSYAILDPSISLARRMQKQGDYVTATLLYEAILERNPSESHLLKNMIQCYEALTKKEMPERASEIGVAKPVADDGFSDLPDLLPPDNRNAQQHQSPDHPLL